MNSIQLKTVKNDFLNGQVVDYLNDCRVGGIKLDVYRGRVIGLNVESQKEYIDWVEYMYKTYGFTPKQTSNMVISVINEHKEIWEAIDKIEKHHEDALPFEKIIEDVFEAELNTAMGCIAWNKFFGGGK